MLRHLSGLWDLLQTSLKMPTLKKSLVFRGWEKSGLGCQEMGSLFSVKGH